MTKVGPLSGAGAVCRDLGSSENRLCNKNFLRFLSKCSETQTKYLSFSFKNAPRSQKEKYQVIFSKENKS